MHNLLINICDQIETYVKPKSTTTNEGMEKEQKAENATYLNLMSSINYELKRNFY